MAPDLYMRIIEQNILQPVGMTRTVFPAGAEMPSPHARGYFKMPDGKVVDATDWNPSWGWASGNMISTLDDMRVWTRDLAMGKLLSPAILSAGSLSMWTEIRMQRWRHAGPARSTNIGPESHEGLL